MKDTVLLRAAATRVRVAHDPVLADHFEATADAIDRGDAVSGLAGLTVIAADIMGMDD